MQYVFMYGHLRNEVGRVETTCKGGAMGLLVADVLLVSAMGVMVKVLRTMDGTIFLLEGECKGESGLYRISLPANDIFMSWLATKGGAFPQY